MKLEASTIDELFDAAAERGDELRSIDALITETAPGLSRELFAGSSITMIGYGAMTWAPSADGTVWPVIGLTAQKRHISLYVAADRDGVPLAEYYTDRLGKTNNGRGCIRFSKLANVDREQLAQAIRDAEAWASAQG